jgi:hypothetical protein
VELSRYVNSYLVFLSALSFFPLQLSDYLAQMSER